MEQLRHVGEALGGINAYMAFQHELRVNPRQCRLLADACALAFDAVAEEVRAHLRFDDRLAGAKWKTLEAPLRELQRAVHDAGVYIRHCLGPPREGGGGGGWWTRAATNTHGTECVELHMHGLLWCVAMVLEAVEAATEVAAGSEDPEELYRRRLLFARDYDRDTLDVKLFRRSRVGRMYLAAQELAARMDTAWKEDRWLLCQMLDERKAGSASSLPDAPPPLTRHQHRLADLLSSPRGKLHPASVLLNGGEFHLRRRLGGSLKEVQWMGETLAVKHLTGIDADAAAGSEEIALLTKVAHPNVAHCRYCFHDEDKKEVYLLMDQLMSKDLRCYVKEVNNVKRRLPFPLVVVVDVMLQIARGMEHLHSRKIYHGDLNPSNVLVKTRHADAYLHVKVAGFAKPACSPAAPKANAGDNGTRIWYAPEVLEAADKRTEKADVYSFAMICFELLTGKIPFEDNHLQGENMSKNIRAGERPLFSFQAPKYLLSLIRRCWQPDPDQRPPFASICRVLRYAKRFLVMHPPDPQQPDAVAPAPLVDYLDVEAQLLRKFPAWAAPPRVSDVPFEMYAYRVMDRDRSRAAALLHAAAKDKSVSDSSSDGNSSLGGDDCVHAGPGDVDTSSMSSRGTTRSLPARTASGRMSSPLKSEVGKVATRGLTHKSSSTGTVKPPAMVRRAQRIRSDGQLRAATVPPRRRMAASDSELA